MAGYGGGVGAAFGFRYQYLLTVEVLLDLYAEGPAQWSVDVDPVSQDSADIVVRRTSSGPPERVIQVKASLADSSTTIGVSAVQQILARLDREHPAAQRREIVTNRTQTAELIEELSKPRSPILKDGEYFVLRKGSSHQLTEELLYTLGNLRVRGVGGVGRDLHYLLLRQLVDRVHEAGARPHDQSIDYENVRGIIEGANSLVANALGSRNWGTCIQVPRGDFIERSESARFLKKELSAKFLYEGAPRVAVLKGLSGTGKSAAACRHIQSLLEHVAFVLWLDASSAASLEDQVPMVLNQLGVQYSAAGVLPQDFVQILSEIPVPWMLVLDDASSSIEIDPWIPRSGYGQVLLTTQDVNWPQSFASSLHMDAFCESEARQFVAYRLGQSVELWSSDQLSACAEITRSLAGWPLALELAISWIVRHGGSMLAMQQFAERIDRLDLNDESLLPHGYPQTAANTVLSQWAELSLAAQSFASCLLLLGGSRVPKYLFLDLAVNQAEAAAVLEELFISGFIRQEIIDSRQPHDLDEVISIHGFVQLVMSKYEASINMDTARDLVVSAEKLIQQSTEEGRFNEGVLLVRPVDSFLRQMIQNFVKQPEILVLFSTLMHNLAQLAFVTSQVTIAQWWSRMAFEVRSCPPDQIDRLGWVRMQLQTLSLCAVIEARLHKVEDLIEVGKLVGSLLREVDKHTLDDQETNHALRQLRDVLSSYLSDSSLQITQEVVDVVQQLNRLVPQDMSEFPLVGAGNELIRLLQLETSTARQLVEHSAWKAGVDTVLSAANRAMMQGVLVDLVVDQLLDVGRVLMIESIKRPLETPELLIDSAKRIVIWLEDNSSELGLGQQSRYLVLSAFVKESPGALSAAVMRFPSPEERLSQLEAWETLVNIINEQHAIRQRTQLFSDLAPSVNAVHSIDGGDSLNIWWRDAGSSKPELWVHAPGIVTISSLGRSDPICEGMERAGLPEIVHGKPALLVDGWSVRLDGSSIVITDADGVSWVETENIPEDIVKQIKVHGGLILVYGDLAIAQPTDRILGGWIPLGASEIHSHHDLQNGSEDRFVTWWRRLAFWRY